LYLRPSRRYKREVSKTKPSPVKAKERPAPKAGGASGTAEILATVHAKAKMLSEALPYMQRYDKQTVVVKYGGHALRSPPTSPATSCSSSRPG